LFLLLSSLIGSGVYNIVSLEEEIFSCHCSASMYY
jgi:hypothetical protein